MSDNIILKENRSYRTCERIVPALTVKTHIRIGYKGMDLNFVVVLMKSFHHQTCGFHHSPQSSIQAVKPIHTATDINYKAKVLGKTLRSSLLKDNEN